MLHLAFNMFALWMFGGMVERVFGTRRYLMYYFACVVSAALTQLAFSVFSGGIYPTVGASGGVFGLLLAYARYFPTTA
jgi:membrane associated rhomboid family serine protease